MSDLLQVIVDPVQMRELEESLSAAQIPKAIVGAVNKTGGKVKTKVIRGIADNVPFAVAVVREQVGLRKANAANPTAVITVSHKKIPLYDYKPIQTPRGVIVRTSKIGAAQLYKHTFIATVGTGKGHIGVFYRAPNWIRKEVINKKGQKVMHGLPIKEAYGPSLVGVFGGAPGLLQSTKEFAAADLQKQISSQIDRFMQRRKADRESDSED